MADTNNSDSTTLGQINLFYGHYIKPNLILMAVVGGGVLVLNPVLAPNIFRNYNYLGFSTNLIDATLSATYVVIGYSIMKKYNNYNP